MNGRDQVGGLLVVVAVLALTMHAARPTWNRRGVPTTIRQSPLRASCRRYDCSHRQCVRVRDDQLSGDTRERSARRFRLRVLRRHLFADHADGVVHVIDANLPCIGGTSGEQGCSSSVDFIESPLIPYTIDLLDVVGGIISASATYSAEPSTILRPTPASPERTRRRTRRLRSAVTLLSVRSTPATRAAPGPRHASMILSIATMATPARRATRAIPRPGSASMGSSTATITMLALSMPATRPAGA